MSDIPTVFFISVELGLPDKSDEEQDELIDLMTSDEAIEELSKLIGEFCLKRTGLQIEVVSIQ